MNLDLLVPADTMSEEQTFRSEVGARRTLPLQLADIEYRWFKMKSKTCNDDVRGLCDRFVGYLEQHHYKFSTQTMYFSHAQFCLSIFNIYRVEESNEVLRNAVKHLAPMISAAGVSLTVREYDYE